MVFAWCCKTGKYYPLGLEELLTGTCWDIAGQECFFLGLINLVYRECKKRHITKYSVKSHYQHFHPATLLQTSTFTSGLYFCNSITPGLSLSFLFSLFFLSFHFFNLYLLLLWRKSLEFAAIFLWNKTQRFWYHRYWEVSFSLNVLLTLIA